jgi:hypothetical protein
MSSGDLEEWDWATKTQTAWFHTDLSTCKITAPRFTWMAKNNEAKFIGSDYYVLLTLNFCGNKQVRRNWYNQL